MIEKDKKPTGVASLVCGILSILLFLMPYFGLPLGILALVFARKIDSGMAIGGKICGIIGIVINSITLFVIFIALLIQWAI